MQPPALFIKTANPAGSGVVGPVPSEHAVHLIDELQHQTLEIVSSGLLIKPEKVADRKSVGP
jgi:hypothetical protein